MAKSKSKKKSAPKYSSALFKAKGPDAKLKVKAKKKTYYFLPKTKPEKATKLALGTGAEIFGTTPTALKAGKPVLKYELYINCDAVVEKILVQTRDQEIGVQNEMAAALVGKEIILPKKASEPPLRRITLDIVEIYDVKRADKSVYDGRTGSPARSMEKVVKGSGKKSATSAWIKKAKVVSGKFNTIEKFLKAYTKNAAIKPKSVKRSAQQSLTFKKLEGFYVPVYYIKVAKGAESKLFRVNALNNAVMLG